MQAKALKFHLEVLQLESEDGEGLEVGKTLLINAAPGAYLDLLEGHQITVFCSQANIADKWSAKGVTTIQEISELKGKFDNIIHFATKFATENLTTIGQFSQFMAGAWLSIIPNRTGASRLKKDITKFFDEVVTTSKAKCRIFQSSSEFDSLLARQWTSLNKPKKIKGTELETVPGVFSAEKIDTGSKLLAEVIAEESWYGSVADLGSAYGFLSHSILSVTRQKVKRICLYELDYRALECAKSNLSGFSNKVDYHWVDVTAKVPHERPFDMVVMNPPFHEAQDASFELGKTFIKQAASILKPGGTLYLVANIHLPYEKEIQEQFRSHRLLREENGFKLFLARK